MLGLPAQGWTRARAARPARKLATASLPCSKRWRRSNAQPERQATLLRAASGLRAAVNKAQAVLAITACYNVINAALKQASVSGKGVRGMGGAEGLGLVVGIVARAVRLIQAKG